MFSQVYRLSLVAKVLQDKAFAELIKENKRLVSLNQKLELALFWKDFDVNALFKAMSSANKYHPEAPRCVCIDCASIGRADDEHVIDVPCSFKPWFENKLAVLEMTALHGFPSQNHIEPLQHICSGDTEYVLDVDAHFVNMARQNWTWFTYGSLLWKATSIHDAHVQLLTRLFDELNRMS